MHVFKCYVNDAADFIEVEAPDLDAAVLLAAKRIGVRTFDVVARYLVTKCS